MTLAQKTILIALLVVGGLCLVVGFALMHYIGGFMRTVEEEAREEEAREQEQKQGRLREADAAGTPPDETRSQ